MSYSIRFKIPNGQVDPRLAGNSRYSRAGRTRLGQQNRRDAFNLTKGCLDGVEAEEFLTNCGAHPLEAAFPVTLVCRRVYSGRAQAYDDDNIRLAYKNYRDGICQALGIEDDPTHLTGQYPQERGKDGQFYLEFEVVPAWAKTTEKKAD